MLGQIAVVFDLEDHLSRLERRYAVQSGVEQIVAEQPAVQPLVERDAHVLGRMRVGLAVIVHDDGGAQQVQAHFAEHVAQERIVRAVKAGRVAVHELLAQPARDAHGGFRDELALLVLALEEDLAVGAVVDADAVFVALLDAVHLGVVGRVVDVVEIQRADEIFVVGPPVRVGVQHAGEQRGELRVAGVADEVFQLVARIGPSRRAGGKSVLHGSHLNSRFRAWAMWRRSMCRPPGADRTDRS